MWKIYASGNLCNYLKEHEIEEEQIISINFENLDFELLKEIVDHVNIPVIMEGHTDRPEQVTKALEIGAYAVVVGSIITRPQLITARYVAAAKSVREGD